MRNLWLSAIFVSLLISCRQDQKTGVLVEETGQELKAEELPRRVQTNAKATKILNDWPEFTAFETSFDALYTAANNEDLILVIDELLEKHKLWEKSVYPEAFDKPQIKSRQNVLKTYILKLKAALINRADFVNPTTEMVEAYNALRGQFNVVMNSTLDPKLLSDEQ